MNISFIYHVMYLRWIVVTNISCQPTSSPRCSHNWHPISLPSRLICKLKHTCRVCITSRSCRVTVRVAIHLEYGLYHRLAGTKNVIQLPKNTIFAQLGNTRCIRPYTGIIYPLEAYFYKPANHPP